MKKYFSAVAAVILSGMALLAFLLAARTETSYASLAQVPADTPDLIINVEAGDQTVLANEIISYVILYTNTLVSPLSDVVISSTLSPNQYFTPPTYLSDPIIPTTSFTYTGGFYSGYILEWQVGTLAADTGGWIVITATVPLEAEPPWKDDDQWPLLGMSAVITTSTPGVSAGNPQGAEGDSVSVMVVGPVLRLTKTDDPDPVRPGRLLTYTLTLENKDREDAIAANGIVITDELPAKTIFHSASATSFYSATSPSTGLVIWQPPDSLEPGSTMEVTFTVRLTESMACQPTDLKNWEENYTATADETIRVLIGDKDIGTRVDDVLEKTIETPALPSGAEDVFPGGIVTYTISVYNPRHNQPILIQRLTDTLPGNPTPFIFLDMLTGTNPITTSPEMVWENLNVDAGGVTELAFRAQVPNHIYLAPNRTDRNYYYNSLSASVSDLVICDMKDRDTSRADVNCQVCLSKDVEPDHVLSGEIVTYTIILENTGDTTISSIRLTDTLPSIGDADFSYVDLVYGPAPADVYTNGVVWDGLSVAPFSEIEISFHAMAIGWPLEKYGNYLSASTPETTIPALSDKARVEIDVPFTIGKTVAPDETFVEQSVVYTITVCNVSNSTYTLDKVADQLPGGFYEHSTGFNHFEKDLSPAVDIAPDECWDYSFTVDVTIDVGCGNLPHTYKNEDGNVGIHLEGDPPDSWWVNSVDLAPLLVKPHVAVDKEADHTYVMPGETFVYTVTLTNESPVQVQHLTIIDTLPGDDPYFEYVEMVAGPSPSSTPPTVRWEDQTVPAGGQLVLAFRVRVPEDMPLGSYKNQVLASTTDWVCIEEIDPTAQVKVVEEVVEFTKVVDPDQVPPLGIMRYEIRLKNLDSVPITGVVVTETLPSALGQDFEFVGMVTGDPEPSEVNGRQVVWTDLTILAGQTLKLRFDAQATILFGVYNNDVVAWCPRSETIEPEHASDIAAPVTVLPGVVLYKNVFPTQTVNGGTVVYTITLYNGSDTALENVRITDTLPASFQYQRMLPGYPAPDFRQSSIVAWDLGQVGKGNSEELVFQVGVHVLAGTVGVTETYFNKVEGYSPSALVPSAEETAPVKVAWKELPTVYLPLVLRNYTQ